MAPVVSVNADYTDGPWSLLNVTAVMPGSVFTFVQEGKRIQFREHLSQLVGVKQGKREDRAGSAVLYDMTTPDYSQSAGKDAGACPVCGLVPNEFETCWTHDPDAGKDAGACPVCGLVPNEFETCWTHDPDAGSDAGRCAAFPLDGVCFASRPCQVHGCDGTRSENGEGCYCDPERVTSVEPGCTCGGMASCLQCQERDAAQTRVTPPAALRLGSCCINVGTDECVCENPTNYGLDTTVLPPGETRTCGCPGRGGCNCGAPDERANETSVPSPGAAPGGDA